MLGFVSSAALLLAIAPALASSSASRPNIVHILIDDFGWNQVGYHNDPSFLEVSTPNIDSLKNEGIELDRFYVHKICSPSRTSIQSGRSPIHVNVQNVHPEVVNEEDPLGGFQGMALNMTSVGDVLKDAGYKTSFVGKWDVGMATRAHTPHERGYDEFLGYYHHSNDYWQQTEQKCSLKKIKDLWIYNETFDGPAVHLANDPACGQDNQELEEGKRCQYEEEILLGAVLDKLDEQAAAEDEDPLFMFYSTHLTHMPLQVPQEYLDKFGDITNEYRQSMRAMSYYVDMEVGAVVDKLKSTGLWDNTLLVLHSDNGGEIMTQFCGSNNHPLRGGKFSNFDGGIRVNALVSGGFVPSSRRGVKEERLVAGEDWLRTYASVAGVGDRWTTDSRAVEAGLPDFDSVDQWPMLSGESAADATARSEVWIGDTTSIEFNGDGDTLVGGLLRDDGWKVVLGAENKMYKICQDVTTPAKYPDGKFTPRVPELKCRKCGRTPEDGCLFNVRDDEAEENNMAEEQADIFDEMIARIDELQESVYSPTRGKTDKRACKAAKNDYGGYWGPFL